MLVGALVLAAALVAPAGVVQAQVAFTFADARITESSGLASSATGELLFTHNDSGDAARVYAVGGDGRTVATYLLPGVEPRDWEDMARGPDEQGRSSLWLGDIGDNSAVRGEGIVVHRVLEPVPDGRVEVTTEAPTSFWLRYPDGPRDAEGLAVHPQTGRLYVVTKPLVGAAQVYAAPQPLDADGPNVLELVGHVQPRATGTPGGPGIGAFAQLLVTAADIAPDGSRFAVRTYTDVYEWDLDPAATGDVLRAALEAEPRVRSLPPVEQGEGLAYATDSASLLTSSEGQGAPVHRIPTAAVQTGGRDQTAAPETTAPGTNGPAATTPDEVAASRLPLVAGAAGLVLLAVLVLRRPGRRTGRRRDG